MFYGCAGHLDEFCFRRNRIAKKHFEYARNSYRDEFFDFPPRSYSCVLPRTSSHALSHFSHGPNHCSYGFGSRENNLFLDTLVTTHILIVVIVSCVGIVFLLESITLTLSQDSWTVHVFSVIVHVPLNQLMKCERR
jgi:hypothetical protein